MATKKDEGVIEATPEADAKPAKEKLTPEQRAEKVRAARQEKLDAAFKGQTFDYLGKVSLEGDQRYIDVTGNKGRHGHRLRNKTTGDEIIVGPGNLKVAVDMGAVTLPPKPPKEEATAPEAALADA